ncbi:hypothetical protein I3843_11G039200 [Carya illinoinensis]|nr:hypothetical protein I3843_11G039200 [Carya illinoinensis]
MQVLHSKEFVPNCTLQCLIQIWYESVSNRKIVSAESTPLLEQNEDAEGVRSSLSASFHLQSKTKMQSGNRLIEESGNCSVRKAIILGRVGTVHLRVGSTWSPKLYITQPFYRWLSTSGAPCYSAYMANKRSMREDST